MEIIVITETITTGALIGGLVGSFIGGAIVVIAIVGICIWWRSRHGSQHNTDESS